MRACPVVIVLVLAAGCGAPSGPVGPRAAAAPPPASLRLSLGEGQLEGELRIARLVEPFILQEPARVLTVEGPGGAVAFRIDPRWVSAALFHVAPASGELRVRFAAAGLDEALRRQSHVSEERVELGGWYWYPAPDAPLVVEVASSLPSSMRLIGSGARRDGRWHVARGERFALVGISDPGELRAPRARIVYDAGWLDRDVARDLVERASDAASAFERAFGPTRRRFLTIAMPPREGGGYWTDGLIVVGQYYAGYGRDDDDAVSEPREASLAVEAELTSLGYTPAASTDELPLEEVRIWRRYAIVHEVAHEWWHGYPEIAGWLSLDEGLAQYSVLMVADDAMREQALGHHIRSIIDDSLRAEPRPTGWNADAYDRSPLFFLGLEAELGRERVHRFLRALRVAHARAPLDEPTFRALLAESLGPGAVEMLDERTPSR